MFPVFVCVCACEKESLTRVFVWLDPTYPPTTAPMFASGDRRSEESEATIAAVFVAVVATAVAIAAA